MQHPDSSCERYRAVGLTLLVLAGTVAGVVAFSGAALSDTSTTDGSAGTSYVARGATNQTPLDAAGGTAIALQESAADDFRGSGTVRLEIPRSSGLRFDRANSSLAVNASGSSGIEASNVAFDGERAVVFEVDGASDLTVETLNVSGVRVRVPTTTRATNLTWTYGELAVAYAVVPQDLNAAVEHADLVRGAANQPRGGTRVVVASETAPVPDGQRDEPALPENDLQATGFHAAGENVTVSIPHQYRDELAFDTDHRPTVAVDSTGGAERPAFVDEYRLTFRIGERVDAGEEVELAGVRFDATGVDGPAAAEFAAPLVVSHVPVAAVDPPTRVATGADVDVHAPTVAIGDPDERTDSDVVLQAGADGTTGENGTHVTVRDDADGASGEISSAGTVSVGLPADAGVTFDRSQDLAVERVGDGALDGRVRSVNDTTVVVAVDSTSADGDALVVGAADGTDGDGAVDPIRFNVSADSTARDVPFVVSTHGGDARIVQNTTGDRDESEVRDVDVVGGGATPTATSTETGSPTPTETGSPTPTATPTDAPEDETPAASPTPTATEASANDVTATPDDRSGAATASPTSADDVTATRTAEPPTGTSTDAPSDRRRDDVSTSVTTTGSTSVFGPGFGVVPALVALLALAAAGLRRRT